MLAEILYKSFSPAGSCLRRLKVRQEDLFYIEGQPRIGEGIRATINDMPCQMIVEFVYWEAYGPSGTILRPVIVCGLANKLIPVKIEED